MTKAEVEILTTLLGSRHGNVTINPRPYTGLLNSREHRAANKLAGLGLCKVRHGPREGVFTALAVAFQLAE